MSDATLLPCPFCGGTPVGIEHPPHKHVFATFMPDHPGSYTIECPSCNAGMIDSTEDACVAAWNARTAKREVARLREALKLARSIAIHLNAKELEREVADTIKLAETMAATGASATHIIELFRALKGKP